MSERPIYQIRHHGSSANISLPKGFANLIPEGTLFEFKTTERGFEFVVTEPDAPDELPEWLASLQS